MIKQLASFILTSMVLVLGCSSNHEEKMAARLAVLEKVDRDRIAEQKVFKQSQRKEELNVVPSWYLSPLEADGTGVFGVGYSRSKQLGHALKSARLQAEFELAKMFKQELYGSERFFERGNTDGDVVTQTIFMIDKIVDAVPVVGYTVVEQKMVPLNGTFETFVLLKLPYDEFNKVLKSQRETALDRTVQASFDDLEHRLNNRRSQREQEEQSRFQREQEAQKNRSNIMQQGGAKLNEQSATLPFPFGVINTVTGGNQ